MLAAEAITKIENLVKQSSPIVRAPDFEAVGRYYRRDADGSLIEEVAERAPRSTTLLRTGDLVNHAIKDTDVHDTNVLAVYVASGMVTAELESSDTRMRWTHTLLLPLHPAFKALEGLTVTRAFVQRDLIRFLRATLNGHVADTVVETFRTLKVATDGESNSVLAKGREAVDRRIQEKVTAAAGSLIPDEIVVTVPVYDLDETREETHEITLLVEVAMDDGTPVFEVTTVLNSLREAQRTALDRIAANVREALAGTEMDVPVYYGKA